MKVTAIHQIQILVDKKVAIVEPGSVFEVDAEEAARLESLGAVARAEEAPVAPAPKSAEPAQTEKSAVGKKSKAKDLLS